MPRIITKKRIDKEFLTTKLTLIIIGLTAGSGLLIPATYASFHPVTTGEIADDTIRSADISNTAGVASADIINGQVSSVDIRDGQVSSVDIVNDAIKPNIQIVNGNMTVAPGGSNSIMLFCPTGTLITGGGFGKENEQVNILASISVSSDRWFVSASNSGVGDALVNARALCIGPMP